MRQTRLLALFAALMLLFSVAMMRLYAIVSDPAYAARAEEQTGTDFLLSDGRGILYDYNFVPLTGSQSEPVALVYSGMQDYNLLFDLVVPEDRGLLYRKSREDVPYLVRLNAPTRLVQTYQRVLRYDATPTAVHTVGYLDADGHGVAGLERTFDALLRQGTDTVRVHCQNTASMRAVLDVQPQLEISQGSGGAIQTTLDAVLQRVCEGVAASTMEKGAIVVLEVATGRIKACVSMPRYDPKDVQSSIEARDTALINRALSAYNVGSVFKPLLAALAIENGADWQEDYFCTGETEVQGQTYHCARTAGHGRIDMQGALERSCNCYFIRTGLALGGEKLYDFAYLLGFGQATPLGGGYIGGSGSFPAREELTDDNQLASVSFGQGKLTATPVQMAAAFNIIANRGVYISPTLVEARVNSYTKEVEESYYHPEQLQVVSEQTAQRVKQMLVSTVENGLGAGAALEQVQVGGKTGTAQTGRFLTDEETGQQTEICEAWFAGFYPAEDPQYTIVVLQDSGTHTGEETAGIFARVCRQLYYLSAG